MFLGIDWVGKKFSYKLKPMSKKKKIINFLFFKWPLIMEEIHRRIKLFLLYLKGYVVSLKKKKNHPNVMNAQRK